MLPRVKTKINTLKTFELFISECTQTQVDDIQIQDLKCEDWRIWHFEHEETMSNYDQCFLMIEKREDLELRKPVIIEYDNRRIMMKILSFGSIDNNTMVVHCVHDIYFQNLIVGSEIFINKTRDEVLHEKLKGKIQIKLTYAAAVCNIITQYEESNFNLMNRLLFRLGLPWQSNDDGTVIASKDTTNWKTYDGETTLFQPVFYRSEASMSKMYGYDTQEGMHYAQMDDKMFYFSNEMRKSDQDEMNRIFDTFFSRGFGYSLTTMKVNTFDRIKYQGKTYIVTKSFTSFKLGQYYPFYVEMKEDKHTLGEFTMPNPGMQTATIDNTYEGPSNFIEKSMNLTAKIHFDQKRSRVPVYFSNFQFSQHNQFFNLPRQHQLILVYFVTIDFPVFITSMPNFENKYKVNDFDMCKNGWIMESVSTCDYVTVSDESTNNLGNYDDRSNQIIFNNENRMEEIYMQAQHDLKVTVRDGNHTTIIEKGDCRIKILQGSIHIEVHKDHTLQIGNDFQCEIAKHSSIKVGENYSLECPKISIKCDTFELDATDIHMRSVNIRMDVANNTSLTSSMINVKASDLSIDTGRLSAKSGDLAIKSGITNIDAGDTSLKCGVLGIASGDTHIECGAFELVSGFVDITAGDLAIESGAVEIMAGAICLMGVVVTDLIIASTGLGLFICGLP
jgi:hypothetical protein